MRDAKHRIEILTLSNHQANLIKHIPGVAECRLSRNSSTREIFKEKIKVYHIALKEEGYNAKLSFKPQVKTRDTKNCRRTRKAICFNPQLEYPDEN